MAWDRDEADALFKELVTLDVPTRETRLAALRERDAALGDHLADMLDRYKQMENMFEASVMPKGMLQMFSDDDDDEDAEPPTRAWGPEGAAEPEKMPERIGPYKVLSKIGEGGMGLVYQVRQEEPRRDLALKILAHHRTTAEFRARFEAEYRVLALMAHHHIAAIHEVGHTDEGHVYFTMEYVPGIPITRYCAERKLNLRARLLLFQQMCEGVMHAHQKAVVHRDLKPSNILVTEVNGRPVVKIIDFGIAKGLAESDLDRRFQTRLGTLVGTLEYMSYEQLLGTEATDTRVDIYALGVVLYEMLVGALPLDAGTVRESSAEAQLRFYREKEAPAPSQRLKGLWDAGSQGPVAPQELRGDLDWIVLKAMEKDLARRYGTVGELKQDLNHFLDDEPVSARSPTYAYFLAKFVRRNRVFVGSGMLVVSALVIGLWVSVSANFRVNRARLETEKALRHLQATNTFLQDMLSAADPNKQGVEAKVVDVLERAETRIDNELANTPEVEASLRLTLGTTYRGLGLYERSIDQLDRAYTVYRALRGENDPVTLNAHAEYAQALRQGGQKEKAKAHYREIIRLSEEVYGPEDRKTLHAKASFAFCFLNTPQVEEVLDLLRDVLETQSSILGPRDKDTMRTMNGLATIYENSGRYILAASVVKKAYEAQREILGPNHPQTLSSLFNYGHNLSRGGQWEQAGQVLDEVLEKRTQFLGEDHPTVMLTENRIIENMESQDQLSQALDKIQRLVNRSVLTLGLDSPDSLSHLYVCARVFGKTDGPIEALTFWQELIDIYGERFERDSYARALFLKEALCLKAKGDYTEGIAHLKALLEWDRENLGGLHPGTLATEVAMGSFLVEGGGEEWAGSFFCDSLARADFVDDETRWVQRKNYAQYCLNHGSTALAADLLMECLEEAPEEVLDRLELGSILASLKQKGFSFL